MIVSFISIYWTVCHPISINLIIAWNFKISSIYRWIPKKFYILIKQAGQFFKNWENLIYSILAVEIRINYKNFDRFQSEVEEIILLEDDMHFQLYNSKSNWCNDIKPNNQKNQLNKGFETSQ